MNKLFYKWAFIDMENTCDPKKTYFCTHSEEVAETNLSMIKSMSLFISIIGLVVIGMALTFFEAPLLALIYVIIIGMQLIAIGCVYLTEKMKRRVVASNILSSIYLLHMLAISGVLSTVYSKKESALVYVVVLIISQVLFILPPIVTTFIGGVSLINTFVLSYLVKSSVYFKSDIINCVCVFILSVLLGWRFTKIRIEEAQAKNEAINLSKELKKLSLVDQLTNLENHRSFQNTYYQLFEKLKLSNEQLGIIMMDIDKFKAYNDGYGHLDGDICLNKIGTCFGKQKSEDVVPYRFGGEEFIIIVKGKSCEHLDEIAEKFRTSVEELSIPHEYSAVSNVVTISAGYYLGCPAQISKPTQLVDYADQALYKSKRAGGNTVTCGE